MRLGIISPYITSDFVSETFYNVQAYGLSRELARRGTDVSILTCRKKGDPREKILENTSGRVAVKYIRPNLVIRNAPMMNPAAVLGNIRENSYDCLQVSGDFSPTSYYLGMFRTMIATRLVVYQGLYRVPDNTRGRFYFSVLDPLFRRRMNESVDAVISKTRTAESFMRTRGYPNVCTIPVGVDTSTFRPLDRLACKRSLGICENEKLLLYVGRLDPSRDVETCLRAVAKLSRLDDKVRLLIVGTGTDINRLSQIARELDVHDSVTWMAKVENKHLPPLYSAADITLLPMSRNTLFTFGMTIPESLACGTPVISAPIPAALDHIKNGYNGAVVGFGDASALSDAAAEILSSDSEHLGMSRNARAYCCSNLDWRVLADRYMDVYKGS